MYDSHSPLVSRGVVGEAAWAALLRRRGADLPDLIASLYHRDAPAAGLNPDLALAQACLETGFFTSDRWLRQRNPAGIGITASDVPGIDFETPEAGIRAHLAHLCCYAYSAEDCPAHPLGWSDPRHSFHDGHLGGALWTLRGGRAGGHDWATEPDYIGRILPIANLAADAEGGGAMVKVALLAGHHNQQGGNAVEHRLVGEIAEAWARHLRAVQGVSVEVITPDGPDPDTDPGDGEFPGSLSAAARRAADLAADLMVEMHTEAGPRGVFVIYPDWDDDTDADVRDRLGPELAGAIATMTGLPVRSAGGMPAPVMSERATGVGAGGSRLGVFAATAHKAATMTRLLVEHGAHSQPADLAILERPDTAEKIGRAAAAVVARFYGLSAAEGGESTDNALDAEYGRLGGEPGLGGKRFKGRLEWHGWMDFAGDVLVCERGAVATDSQASAELGRLLTGVVADVLKASGALRVYGPGGLEGPPEPPPAPEPMPPPEPAPTPPEEPEEPIPSPPAPTPPKPPAPAKPYPAVVKDNPADPTGETWLNVSDGRVDYGVSVRYRPDAAGGAGPWPDTAQWIDTSYPGRTDPHPDWLKKRQLARRLSMHPAIAEALMRRGAFDRLPRTELLDWQEEGLSHVDGAPVEWAERLASVGKALGTAQSVRSAFFSLGVGDAEARALAAAYRCLRVRTRALDQLAICGR